MFGIFSPKGHLLHAAVLCCALSSCTAPQDIANIDHVVSGAKDPDATFAVQMVTQATLPVVQNWPDSHPDQTTDWIPYKATSKDAGLEPGDRVSLAIWDNDDSSLLGQTGQKVIQLPEVHVSGAGSIFLPYVGEVQVAGKTATEARSFVEKQLHAIIPSAQVQLTAMAGARNSVHVISGVPNPGSVPLVDTSMTVTSVLAQSGGIPANMLNPQISLQRGGKIYKIAAEKLLSDPALDTTVLGNDKIFVRPDSRYFLSLGAAGREAVIDFPHDTVTTLEAMSLIGGVNQDAANPKAILVMRTYPAAAIRNGTQDGPPKRQMVFAFDLTNADGLFSARSFLIQDRDLVLVTQSPLSNASNAVRLWSSMFTGSRYVYYSVQ